MSFSLRVRLSIVVAVLLSSSVLGLYPLIARHLGVERPKWLTGKALKLGLDLQGGVDLVVSVQTDRLVRRETDAALATLTKALHDGGVTPAAAAVDGAGTFSITLSRDSPELDRAASMISRSFITTREPSGAVRFTMRPEVSTALITDAIDRTLETITTRVNELGVSEPSLSRLENRNAIEIQLPGVSEVARAKELLQATGLLEFAIVHDGPSPSPDTWSAQPLADGFKVVADRSRPGATDGPPTYFLVRTTGITGIDLHAARATLDQNQRPAVAFSLTTDGARRFAEVTGANIGRYLAVLLDDRAASVAQIESRIHADGQIAGNFTSVEAQNLAVILRSGTLSTPLVYVSEHTVSASLGADAIRAGLVASVTALVLVALFMLVFYRWAGVNAVLSMLANLIVLLGLLAYSQTVMTLPGIAGFVLTIGIGVDSSVLIFERIKEELAAGHGVRVAIAAGYNRVFRTLLDTHIAALIAAALLFQFGTGPIRGFAVTLSAGLASNLFTSTFVSRTLWDLVDVTESRNRVIG